MPAVTEKLLGVQLLPLLELSLPSVAAVVLELSANLRKKPLVPYVPE